MSAVLKPRKCKNPDCRAKFLPATPFEKLCSRPCMEAVVKRALEGIRLKRQRDQRAARLKLKRELREGRERLKTRRDYEREAQRAFNAWIRARDEGQPCISCGRSTDAKRN